MAKHPPKCPVELLHPVKGDLGKLELILTLIRICATTIRACVRLSQEADFSILRSSLTLIAYG
jgi:hypothetical protein